MIITGYKYETEQEAQDAVQACNTYYGIPVSPDAVTRTWCDYQFANLNEPQFYYIRWNETLNMVLDDPTEFDIIFEEQ
jgi:hypothetical protein